MNHSNIETSKKKHNYMLISLLCLRLIWLLPKSWDDDQMQFDALQKRSLKAKAGTNFSKSCQN